jgi:hypothetical protein
MIMFDPTIVSKAADANPGSPFKLTLSLEKRKVAVQTKEDILVNR